MSVEPGQITGIVGANGAGKSTLFKAILGLVKGDSGRITLFGKEPQQLTREDKEKIGVAFTNAGFNEYLRIKDIVPVLSNVYPSFEKEKFLGSCKKLNLPLDKKLKEFSTGMNSAGLAQLTHIAGGVLGMIFGFTWSRGKRGGR